MIYFAHCVKDYDTEIEQKAIDALSQIDSVENPNQEHHQKNYNVKRMKYFLEDVIPACDKLAYLPIDGNRITCGVVAEIRKAISSGIIVYRIDRNSLKVEPLTEMIDKPLSYDQTIEFLNEGK